ncbi:MAG: glycosyltransferase [Rhodococcus sp. (in: high G+C Gram-positive bacteria)]
MEQPCAILLSAFVVHPDMPSEPGVGWQFLLATLEHAAENGLWVVLLTNRRSTDAIEGRVPAHLSRHLEVVCVDLPFSPSFFRWHEPRFTRLEHEVWVRLAGRRVRAVERAYRILYAQHVVFATEILTTPITRVSPDALRVWGPVGAGGVAGVYRISPSGKPSQRQWLLQTARDLVAGPIARRTAGRVDVVLAQNAATAALVAGSAADVREFPNVVVGPLEQPVERAGREPGPLRLLLVGHIIARKRPELAVALLSTPQLADAVLTVVGDRDVPYALEVRAAADRAGVLHRVVFTGTVDHPGVVDAMSHADVLVHPSGREGASGVVGEATTYGLPVVCFAGTGAASVLEAAGTSGVVVEVSSSTTIDTVADAVIAAAAMPRISTGQWTAERMRHLVDDLAHLARKKL